MLGRLAAREAGHPVPQLPRYLVIWVLGRVAVWTLGRPSVQVPGLLGARATEPLGVRGAGRLAASLPGRPSGQAWRSWADWTFRQSDG